MLPRTPPASSRRRPLARLLLPLRLPQFRRAVCIFRLGAANRKKEEESTIELEPLTSSLTSLLQHVPDRPGVSGDLAYLWGFPAYRRQFGVRCVLACTGQVAVRL